MIRTKRLYTRNGKLYIDSYTEYGRVRIATGCEDSRANRKAILESIDELIYKHIRGERKTTSSLKLRDLCDELLDGLKHIKDTSRLAYTSMANIIISGLGNKDIRLFSAQNVGSFFEGRAPKFEKFFNRLIALANEKNPELNLKPLKIKRIRVVEENEEIEPFSLEEMGLILSTLRANSACTQSQKSELAHKERESGAVSPIITAKRKDLRAEFYALLDSLGLKRRVLYNTRHSFASIMLSQGEEPLWVAAMLGHKNLNITYSHYAKFIPQKSRARAVFLNGVLGLNSACTHARPTGANPSGQSLNECFGSTSVTTTKVAPSSRLAQHLNLTHNPRISCSTCVSNSNLESAQIQDCTQGAREWRKCWKHRSYQKF